MAEEILGHQPGLPRRIRPGLKERRCKPFFQFAARTAPVPPWAAFGNGSWGIRGFPYICWPKSTPALMVKCTTDIFIFFSPKTFPINLVGPMQIQHDGGRRSRPCGRDDRRWRQVSLHPELFCRSINICRKLMSHPGSPIGKARVLMTAYLDFSLMVSCIRRLTPLAKGPALYSPSGSNPV